MVDTTVVVSTIIGSTLGFLIVEAIVAAFKKKRPDRIEIPKEIIRKSIWDGPTESDKDLTDLLPEVARRQKRRWNAEENAIKWDLDKKKVSRET